VRPSVDFIRLLGQVDTHLSIAVRGNLCADRVQFSAAAFWIGAPVTTKVPPEVLEAWAKELPSAQTGFIERWRKPEPVTDACRDVKLQPNDPVRITIYTPSGKYLDQAVVVSRVAAWPQVVYLEVPSP
jgi:hypothetical protein